MKKKLLSQVVLLAVCSLAAIVKIQAQCTGPMSVSIAGSGTGAVLQAGESHTDATCAGNTGSVTISATGGTGPYSGTGTFSQPVGTQSYTVVDALGCMSTVMATVGFSDGIPPSITCPSLNLSVSPDPGACTLTVVGTEYDPVVSDACGISSTQYTMVSGSVSPTMGSSLNGVVLGVGNNVIEWKVTDVNGNTNTCQFTIKVSPCYRITGNLIWNYDPMTGVGNATTALSGPSSDSDGPSAVGALPLGGAYELIANQSGDYTITPSKNINLTNGLDGGDATAIQQHLTGVSVITDLYRLIAADCNKSYTISTLDAAVIRQAVLGNPAALSILNTTHSWRFVPSDYVPAGPVGPFTIPAFPETRSLTGLASDVSGQDFIGIKVGDVAPNYANPANKVGDVLKPLVFRVRNRVLQAGETVEADFTVQNFRDVAAYQFALHFDQAQLQFENIEVLTTDLNLDPSGNFGLYSINQGEIRTLWSVAQGVTLNGTPKVFRVRFTALQSGSKLSDALTLDPGIISAVAYNTALIPLELRLLYVDYLTPGIPGKPATAGLVLVPNVPNPFTTETTVGFELPEACDVQLRVLDLSGREVLRLNGDYPAGYSEERLRFDGADASGVLTLELVTPYGTLTRKMLRVRE